MNYEINIKKQLQAVIIFLCVMIFAVGCSSTKITKGDILVDKKLPRPKTIWVCNFTAATKNAQARLTKNSKKDAMIIPLNSKEKKLAEQLGKSITNQLVQRINEMGLNAKPVVRKIKPQVNDIILRGYLYVVKSGDVAKRVLIGFGYGASTLNTLLDGYQMTTKGLVKLSSANIEAVSGQVPGGGVVSVFTLILTRNPVGLVVAPMVHGIKEMTGGPALEGRAKSTASKIAEVLKNKFQKVGWIKISN